MTWARGAEEALQATLLRIKTGSLYGAHLIELQIKYRNFIQCAACRSQRGSSSHSEHSHPVAIDCWPGANPLSNNGVLVTNFDLYGGSDGEKFLHSIMDPLPGVGRGLWQWGGGLYSADIDTAIACFRRRGQKITNSHTDAMHFELDNWVTSSFVSSYDWGRWTSGAEEDEMTADDWAKMKALLDAQAQHIGLEFEAQNKKIAALQEDVNGLQVVAERTKLYYDGLRDGDGGKQAAPSDEALRRVGIRQAKANEKTLGK